MNTTNIAKFGVLLLLEMLLEAVGSGRAGQDLHVPLRAEDTTQNIEKQQLRYEEFTKAAVVSDSQQCSKIGKNILQKGGSAVDAAVAVFLCIGTVQFYYSGIGGGGFMIVYKRNEKKMYGFDYRETIPRNVNKTLFDDKHRKFRGGLSVAVPSEVKGLLTVWKKFGKLKWAELVQPSIDIARDGFPLKDFELEDLERTDKNIRKLVLKQEEPEIIFKSMIKRENFARTLEKIRDHPNSMYDGELAETIVNDIKGKGGVMTLEDLKDYKVKEREPLKAKLDDLTLYTMPLPTGGPILIHILRICKEFNLTKDDLSTKEKLIQTYHRIIEAFKFANAYRPHFSDPDFPLHKKEFEKFYKAILDPDIAKQHSRMVDDKETHDIPYYSEKMEAREDHGTTQVAILAENGDVVSATGSINEKYGAHFASDTLGIIYNNQLGDSFTVDSVEHKLSSSEENWPRPFVRPLSGMAPSVVIDEKGDAKLVSGGAGGAMIPAAVAWVIMMRLWFDVDIGNALMMSRPHHTLFPNAIYEQTEFPFKEYIVEGLKKKKHKVKSDEKKTVCQIIYKDNESGKIHSKTDPRRAKKERTEGY